MCISNSDDPMDRYKRLLKEHDWFYEYTDDFDVWKRGSRTDAELREMYKAFPPDVAKAVWNKYAPDYYRFR